MSFYVTLEALAARCRPGRAYRGVAKLRLEQLQRMLWREKVRPDRAIPLERVAELVGVEFALWVLPVAVPTVGAEWTVDEVGRVVASGLAVEAFDKWLPDVAALTDGLVSKDVAADLCMDVVWQRQPIAAWRDWAGAVEAQISGMDSHAGARAATAVRALFLARSMVSPSGQKRIPSARRIEAQGRHCAHEAYFDALSAWATGHVRYQDAWALAEKARPHMLCVNSEDPFGPVLEGIFMELLVEAERHVGATAERMLRRCLRGVR